MDPRWQQYADPATAAHRFELANSAGHPPDNRDYAAPVQPLSHAPAAAFHQAQAQARAQAPAQIHHHPQLQHAQAPPTTATYGYDQHTPQHPPSLSSSLSSANTSQSRDVSGDVAMQDVNDSHAGIKYAMRPHHQHHLSGSGRPQSLHSPQEPSSAAQRYSPMEALSPTSSSAYAPKPTMQSPYGGPVQRQSPTRQPDYHSSQSPYHPARSAAAAHQQHQQQQIPGMMPYSPHDAYQSSPPSQLPDSPYGSDPKSPRRNLPHGHAAAAAPKRQIPGFSRIRSPADLRPKVNAQPPFRRAAPEGGFISVRYPSPSPSIPCPFNSRMLSRRATCAHCSPT